MLVFAQRMTMHLNGGNKFSTLQYDIYADGQPTGIRRCRSTDGSPRYKITSDVMLAADGSEFDLLASKGRGVMEWLAAHYQPPRIAEVDHDV